MTDIGTPQTLAAKPFVSMPREETYWQMSWYRFKKHKMAMAGLCFLLLIYLVAILAPYIATHDYMEIDPTATLQPPSREHLAGTDRVGRDIFSRLIYGSRISLSVGFVAAGVAITIGTVVGAVAGYFGGVLDDVLMRITEVIMAMPVLFLLVTIAAVFPRSIYNVMLIIGLTSWPGVARLVRGQFLSLREMDYVEAARSIGVKNSRIVFAHILPNTMAPIIVSATLRVGGAILTESALSFLGLGITNPPSWGTILEAGRNYIRQAPWICLLPGALIFLTVLAFNFVGDGLRDALDPRLK